jgi:hypothetical protein
LGKFDYKQKLVLLTIIELSLLLISVQINILQVNGEADFSGFDEFYLYHDSEVVSSKSSTRLRYSYNAYLLPGANDVYVGEGFEAILDFTMKDFEISFIADWSVNHQIVQWRFLFLLQNMADITEETVFGIEIYDNFTDNTGQFNIIGPSNENIFTGNNGKVDIYKNEILFRIVRSGKTFAFEVKDGDYYLVQESLIHTYRAAAAYKIILYWEHYDNSMDTSTFTCESLELIDHTGEIDIGNIFKYYLIPVYVVIIAVSTLLIVRRVRKFVYKKRLSYQDDLSGYTFNITSEE